MEEYTKNIFLAGYNTKYLGIYLYNYQDINLIEEIIDDIFKSNTDESKLVIAEELLQFVVSSSEPETETIFKSALSSINEKSFNNKLNKFLLTKAKNLENSGFTKWSLFLNTLCEKSYSKQLQSEPDKIDLLHALSTLFVTNGIIFENLGNSIKALDYFNNAENIVEKLIIAYPEKTDFKQDIATICKRQGALYEKKGNFFRTSDLYEKALKINEEIVFKEPHRIDYKKEYCNSLDFVGKSYLSKG